MRATLQGPFHKGAYYFGDLPQTNPNLDNHPNASISVSTNTAKFALATFDSEVLATSLFQSTGKGLSFRFRVYLDPNSI